MCLSENLEISVFGVLKVVPLPCPLIDQNDLIDRDSDGGW